MLTSEWWLAKPIISRVFVWIAAKWARCARHSDPIDKMTRNVATEMDLEQNFSHVIEWHQSTFLHSGKQRIVPVGTCTRSSQLWWSSPRLPRKSSNIDFLHSMWMHLLNFFAQCIHLYFQGNWTIIKQYSYDSQVPFTYLTPICVYFQLATRFCVYHIGNAISDWNIPPDFQSLVK